MPLTAEFIGHAIAAQDWDFGNQLIYNLCQHHPTHNQDQQILAKIWIIGRTYAAAVERRRIHNDIGGDEFYLNVVVPAILNSQIDAWFEDIHLNYGDGDVASALQAHNNLVSLFEHMSGLRKRSLASKYLHFHFPSIFYIFDQRAVNALNLTGFNFPNIEIVQNDNFDAVYTRFFHKCAALKNYVLHEFNINLSPRDMDKYLLAENAHNIV